jgi:hypothetical protein
VEDVRIFFETNKEVKIPDLSKINSASVLI